MGGSSVLSTAFQHQCDHSQTLVVTVMVGDILHYKEIESQWLETWAE